MTSETNHLKQIMAPLHTHVHISTHDFEMIISASANSSWKNLCGFVLTQGRRLHIERDGHETGNHVPIIFASLIYVPIIVF